VVSRRTVSQLKCSTTRPAVHRVAREDRVRGSTEADGHSPHPESAAASADTGQVERFWKTLWDEFLGRTVFAHAVDAQQRLVHYSTHYNFQRRTRLRWAFRRRSSSRCHVPRGDRARESGERTAHPQYEQPLRSRSTCSDNSADQRLSNRQRAEALEVHVGERTQTIPLDVARQGETFTDSASRPTPPWPHQEEPGAVAGTGCSWCWRPIWARSRCRLSIE